MKKRIILFCFLSIIGLSSCSKNAVQPSSYESDAESSSSVELPAQEQPQVLQSEQSEAEYPPEESEKPESLVPAELSRIASIMDELDETEYVSVHVSNPIPTNLHLLEEFVGMFDQGNAAPPLYIWVQFTEGAELVRLDYSGGDCYTATSYNDESTFESSHIIKRAFDYIIPVSEDWAVPIKHTAITEEEIVYDLEGMPALGAIGPQEAVEILLLRIGQSNAANLHDGLYRYWFDPNQQESILHGDEGDFEISGAVLLNGSSYYELHDYQNNGGTVYYVSGDGSIVLRRFEGFSVIADAGEGWISPVIIS